MTNNHTLAIITISELIRETHFVEVEMKKALWVEANKFPFASPTLQVAYNEIRRARMYGEDCLRMLANADDPRIKTPFDEHGATYNGKMQVYANDEADLIEQFRNLLSSTLHDVLDNKDVVVEAIRLWSPTHDVMQLTQTENYLEEFMLYRTGFIQSLKQAHQALGLRLDELQND